LNFRHGLESYQQTISGTLEPYNTRQSFHIYLNTCRQKNGKVLHLPTTLGLQTRGTLIPPESAGCGQRDFQSQRAPWVSWVSVLQQWAFFSITFTPAGGTLLLLHPQLSLARIQAVTDDFHGHSRAGARQHGTFARV
jgi:hypothetical protein